MAPERSESQADANSVKSLAPTPYNPRKAWAEGQGDAFKRSLFEFGDLSGIVKNVRTGNLVGGNKRTDVFREAEGAKIVKTEQEPDKQGTVAHGYVIADGNRFAYREVDWPEAKEKAANLAANKWSAEWEWEGASKLLQELNAKFDLTLTGFQQHELDALLAAEWQPPAVEPMEPHSHHDAVHLVLTKEQHDIFQQAKAKVIVQAEDGDKDMSDGRAVELICADYLSGK